MFPLFVDGRRNPEVVREEVQREALHLRGLKLDPAANTENYPASTEVNDVLFNLSRTMTWATGAIATQRSVHLKGPTLAFVAASTITMASTFEVAGAPLAGTNATITQAFIAQFSHEESGKSGNVSVRHYGSTTAGVTAILNMSRTRGTRASPITAVAQDDEVGRLLFQGQVASATAEQYSSAVRVSAFMDGGAPSTTSAPGRLVFYTTPVGSTTPSERMRINNAGYVGIGPAIDPATPLSLTAANGQQFGVTQLTEATTIAAAATTDTTIQIPANAVVFGVSVRVTTVIPTAATFTVTGATSGTAFNTAAVSTAANSTDPGTKAGAFYNGAAQNVRITPNLTPATATGVVRVTIHYYTITPPTS